MGTLESPATTNTACLGMEALLLRQRPHQNRREHLLPEQFGGQIELGRVDHHARTERDAVKRLVVRSGGQRKSDAVEFTLRHGLEFEGINEFAHRRNATSRFSRQLHRQGGSSRD
jgi:hypothetical protein